MSTADEQGISHYCRISIFGPTFGTIFCEFLNFRHSRRTLSADPASCCAHVAVVRGGVRSAPISARVLRLAFSASPVVRDAVALLLASLASRVAALAPPCPALRSSHAMASSSLQRETTRAPPPPDQLASFHSLVDKCVTACALNRHARASELSGKAADKSEALFGGDSLVVASLRMDESRALANFITTARGSEKDALRRRSFSSLLSVIAILQRRLANNTLLPGTVRKEELEYYAHRLASTLAAKEAPALSLETLQAVAPTIGYNVLLDAMYRSLNYLQSFLQPFWPEVQRKVVEAYVRSLSSPPLLLTCFSTGAPFLRYSKPWTSYLAQPVYLALDFLENTTFWRSSKKTCPHKSTSLVYAQPCSASGDPMR